jgi:competence protein ComEC
MFKKYIKPIFLLSLFGLVLVIWYAVFYFESRQNLWVSFFDVGQGDAIFIQAPNGNQVLVDGGPDNKVIQELGKVMPFHDREIDMIVATHADADHLTGLVRVLTHYDADVIVWNGQDAKTKIFEEWKGALDTENAEILVGRCCMRFTLSDMAFFEILYPLSTTQLPKETQNNYSLVIRFVYGNDSFLFTGDIERQAEYEIAQQNFHLTSDVLKVPHHGSKTSSSELFLEEVSPKIAVISVGRSNPYGHPYDAILQRLDAYGIKIRRTDQEGDIKFISNGNSF